MLQHAFVLAPGVGIMWVVWFQQQFRAVQVRRRSEAEAGTGVELLDVKSWCNGVCVTALGEVLQAGSWDHTSANP